MMLTCLERSFTRSIPAALASRQQTLAIYDAGGRLLASEGRDRDLELVLPALDQVPSDGELLRTVVEKKDDGRKRRR